MVVSLNLTMTVQSCSLGKNTTMLSFARQGLGTSAAVFIDIKTKQLQKRSET